MDDREQIVDFIEPYSRTEADENILAMYNAPHATESYRNFLAWIFATFDETEKVFRERLVDLLRLSKGVKVLITGCGLGDDITTIIDRVGALGAVHAQDISKAMVIEASQ